MTSVKTTPYLSIVSPVYRAENIVDKLVDEIVKAVSPITPDFEIILVEDGSPDRSWERIADNCQKSQRVKGIKLSRNFGQHNAITAGLDFANGEFVIVMDCDLQDQPSEIVKLYNKALEGYDIVLAQRINRRDSLIKKYFSILFYQILSYLSNTKYDPTVSNFGIYSKKVISSFQNMRETIRVFPVMIKWMGYSTAKVEVEHANRTEGKSSYNFNKLLKLSIDIVLAYSDKPIRLVASFGALISIGSFAFALYNLVLHYLGNIKVTGYTSLIISIWFLSGVIITILGMIGLYIGKIFEGVKERPIYFIDHKKNIY